MHSKICDTPSHLNHSFSFFLSLLSLSSFAWLCLHRNVCGQSLFQSFDAHRARITRCNVHSPYAHSISSICALDEAFNRSCGLRKLFKCADATCGRKMILELISILETIEHQVLKSSAEQPKTCNINHCLLIIQGIGTFIIFVTFSNFLSDF